MYEPRIKSISSLDINGVTRLVDILVYFVQERKQKDKRCVR